MGFTAGVLTHSRCIFGHIFYIFRQFIWHSIWHIFSHPIWHMSWHCLWQSICHIFWHSIRHSVWHSILSDICPGMVYGSLSDIYSCILSDINSDILSGILSDIYSGILSEIHWNSLWHSIWHSIWHSFWHSTWHIFYLAVEVQRCPLDSRGPWLRSSGAHWAREVAGWGPAVPTAIRSWQRGEEARRAMLKSNKTHLVGGEKDIHVLSCSLVNECGPTPQSDSFLKFVDRNS